MFITGLRPSAMLLLAWCLLIGQFDVSSLDSLTSSWKVWISSLDTTVHSVSLDTGVFVLRDDHFLAYEHAQFVDPVGGARHWGDDPELTPPLSGVRTRSIRRHPVLPEEQEELGVEPVLCPGGVPRRRAALCREGTKYLRLISDQ